MPLRKSSSRCREIKNIKIIKFLDEYKKHTCLWNPRNDNYKNKSARDDSYEQIISALNIAELEVNDIKLKIKSIRTTYKKELTLVNNALKEGQVYVPKLFWFDKAHSFLKHVLPSSTTFDIGAFKIDEMDSNQKGQECSLLDYGNTTESDKDTKMCNAQNSPTEISFNGNQKYESFDTYQEPEAVQPPVSIETPNPSRSTITVEDDFDLFCRSVAAQLRNISDAYSRSVAKFKIQQILFEAETGHYKRNVGLTLPTTEGLDEQ